MKKNLLSKLILITFMMMPLIMILNGTATAGWSAMNSGTTEYLYDVWGNSGSDVFAVGENGTILHYDGSNWSSMSSGTTEHLYGVWCNSSSDVFVAGAKGTILHFDGTSWNSMTSGTTEHPNKLWGSSGSDVFAVGSNGTTLHYNGTTWTTMSSATGESLRDVWGSSGSNVFAVGDNSIKIHYNGTSWSSMLPVTTGSLSGIWGSSGSAVFAVGNSGTILHYNGTTWTTMSSGTTEYFTDVWGSSGTDVFAVARPIFHYDGTGWSEMESGTSWSPWSLNGIWGSSATDVFAVGGTGIILHYDGTPSPTTFTIAGTIMGDISANVPVELLGDDNQIVDTDNMGHYEFPNLNAGGFYLIIPQLAGYDFDPPQHEIPNLMGDELNMDFLAIKTGPCVAKVIYGEESEEVELLRYIRDNVLSQTPEGREIIRLYYQWSPAIVKAMEEDEEFKEEVKGVIDELLTLLVE
jgi:hypothetical protein